MSVRQERAFDKGISFINIKLVFSMQETLFWSYNRVVHASYLFFYQFFPVSMAALQHTFPSRTRSLRGPATMILHIRVRESSSTPDFFCRFSGGNILLQSRKDCKCGEVDFFIRNQIDPVNSFCMIYTGIFIDFFCCQIQGWIDHESILFFFWIIFSDFSGFDLIFFIIPSELR